MNGVAFINEHFFGARIKDLNVSFKMETARFIWSGLGDLGDF
jgi:hypothetical protein